MKILPLNIKRLGAVPNKVALKWILANISPTMLLIQETMTEGKKVEEVLKECLKDWGMTSCDSDGHSGGTLTAWSPALKMILVHKFDTKIGT